MNTLPSLPSPDRDVHVHSTFSAGAGTIVANVGRYTCCTGVLAELADEGRR
jgi:hypothetical protein